VPNFCENIIVISGEGGLLSSFQKKASGGTATYNSVYLLEDDDWGGFDSIRVAAIYSTPPELGYEQVFSFHSLVPVPEEIRRLPFDRDGVETVCKILEIESLEYGYLWEKKNWGATQTDDFGSSSLVSVKTGELTYKVTTCWKPPLPFMKKVAADWPELNFHIEYSEPGMGFVGEAKYENGKLVFEDWEDYRPY
jgi:hypothetical protein